MCPAHRVGPIKLYLDVQPVVPEQYETPLVPLITKSDKFIRVRQAYLAAILKCRREFFSSSGTPTATDSSAPTL
jgi:hypothetical protein